MVLAEILIEMNNLKRKISQLRFYITKVSSHDGKSTDNAISKLLGLLDKYRSHLILINRVNNETIVSIGESKLSLANAIIILKTIEDKINLLDRLIDNEECVLDVLSLIEQRDKLLEEYTAISKEIKHQEWSIEIDKESMG